MPESADISQAPIAIVHSFWDRLAFDGQNEPTSAEYVGGPPVRNPGLDAEIEDAIMQMEAEPLPRITSLLEAQRPQVLLPRNGIVFQHPVLGGLRLPAISAAGAVKSHVADDQLNSQELLEALFHMLVWMLRHSTTRRSPQGNFITVDLD